MEFDYSDRCQQAREGLLRFMNAYVYPNEAAYYAQHAALPSRWQSPPLMEELKQKLQMGVSELDLSVRASNCLTSENIQTIGELVV